MLHEETSGGSVEESLLVRSDTAVSSVPLPAADAYTAAVGRYDIARFPLRAGASYRAVDKTINGLLDFDGDARADSVQLRIEVTVVGFERVTVPAGSFDNALHQRTVVTQTIGLSSTGRTLLVTATSDDWYAPGVGPVRSLTVVDSDGLRENSEELLKDYRVGDLRSDNVAPTVISRAPADGSLGNNASVRLVFSEDIEPGSLGGGGISIRDGSGQLIPGRSAWQDARTLVFRPEGAGAFTDGSYAVSLNGVPEDWVGNRLAGNVQWSFSIDASGPVQVAQTPAAGAQDVPLDATVSFTFDEELLATPANTISVELLAGSRGAVPVTWDVQGRVIKVTPSSPLSLGQYYLLSVSGLQDRFGNQARVGISTSFTTTRGDPGRYAFPEPLPAFGGRQVYLLRAADLDGDGHPDLLASKLNADGSGTETVIVLRSPDGTLASQPLELPNPACGAQDLTLIDLDADGLTDVLGARSFCGGHWMQQSSAGVWRYGGGLGFSAEQLRAIRLMGQVRPGIVGLDNFDARLVVLRPRGGAGTTEFEPPEVLVDSVNTVTRVLQVADVNGDGREDIVMATGRNGQILLGLQRADATFEMRSINVPNVEHVWLIADFNGDGRADLLLGESGPSTGLVVLPQQADGSFATAGQRYLLPAKASQALLADVDGDGRREIVLAIGSDASTVDNLAVFVPRSDGSFALLPLLQYPSPPSWYVAIPAMPTFAVGEFSGAGPVDLLFLGELIRGREPVVVPAASRGGTVRALLRRGAGPKGQGN